MYKRRNTVSYNILSSDYLVQRPLLSDLQQTCPMLKGKVLDLGCGNQPYRPLLTNAEDYIAYDIDTISSTPVIVGTAVELPFSNASFDGILCTQVLEHLSEPWRLFEEAARVLRPGGNILLTAPQAWRLHEKPFDYYRYTYYGLTHLAQRAGLDILFIRPQGGVWALVGQSIINSLWRSNPKRFTILWFIAKVASLLINMIFGVLDHRDRDTDDTLNYILLAQRTT